MIWDHVQKIKVVFSEDPVVKRDISFYSHFKERVNTATATYAKSLVDSSSEDRNSIYKMTWTWEKGTSITWRPVFMVVSESNLIFMSESPVSSWNVHMYMLIDSGLEII